MPWTSRSCPFDLGISGMPIWRRSGHIGIGERNPQLDHMEVFSDGAPIYLAYVSVLKYGLAAKIMCTQVQRPSSNTSTTVISTGDTEAC